MDELKLQVETDWTLGSEAAAYAALRVLTKSPLWTPDRFGTHEPLRGRYDPEASDAFVAAWRNGALNHRMGAFHFQKRRRYQGGVMWWNEGNSLDSLYLTINVVKRPGFFTTCVTMAQELFEAVNGQYGHLCSREEYWSKNVVDSWVGRSGRREGGRAQGTDRTRHLPGIYWANFFGPEYVSLFGESRLESAPTYAQQRGQKSWVLFTSDTPDKWETPEIRLRAAALLEHLGPDAFFQRDNPTSPTRAPSFVRVQSRAT